MWLQVEIHIVESLNNENHELGTVTFDMSQ